MSPSAPELSLCIPYYLTSVTAIVSCLVSLLPALPSSCLCSTQQPQPSCSNLRQNGNFAMASRLPRESLQRPTGQSPVPATSPPSCHSAPATYHPHSHTLVFKPGNPLPRVLPPTAPKFTGLTSSPFMPGLNPHLLMEAFSTTPI